MGGQRGKGKEDEERERGIRVGEEGRHIHLCTNYSFSYAACFTVRIIRSVGVFGFLGKNKCADCQYSNFLVFC